MMVRAIYKLFPHHSDKKRTYLGMASDYLMSHRVMSLLRRLGHEMTYQEYPIELFVRQKFNELTMLSRSGKVRRPENRSRSKNEWIRGRYDVAWHLAHAIYRTGGYPPALWTKEDHLVFQSIPGPAPVYWVPPQWLEGLGFEDRIKHFRQFDKDYPFRKDHP